MARQTICDECGRLLDDHAGGEVRLAHLSIGITPGGDSDNVHYRSREFCDRACLLAFLMSGKEL